MKKSREKQGARVISNIIIVLLFGPSWINAQPAPCMGENIIIIDSISNVNKDDVEVYLGQINYSESNSHSRYIKSPAWTECMKNNGIDAEKLSLIPSGMFENCGHYTFQSKSSGNFYLIGYSTNDAVLVIKSNQKAMYLVLPNGNSNKIDRYLLGSIFNDFQDDNLSHEKHFYTPNMYLPNISFKEGVFILEDYKLLSEQKTTISLPSELVIEFYDPENGMRQSPLEYWNDTVSFFAPYSNENSMVFSEELEGTFTEKEAIEAMVENSTNYTEEIFSYYKWAKYIENNENTESDIELRTLIYEVIRSQEQAIEKTINSFEDGELTAQQLHESYEILEKEHLMLVLENDFELMNMFCHYLISPKTNIQDFKSIFEEMTYKVNKQRLYFFLEQKQH